MTRREWFEGVRGRFELVRVPRRKDAKTAIAERFRGARFRGRQRIVETASAGVQCTLDTPAGICITSGEQDHLQVGCSWMGSGMPECLNRYARCREIVPVESWTKDGVEGWLFRDRDNRLIFVSSAELQEFETPAEAPV